MQRTLVRPFVNSKLDALTLDAYGDDVIRFLISARAGEHHR